jgi:hypothetical protein
MQGAAAHSGKIRHGWKLSGLRYFLFGEHIPHTKFIGRALAAWETPCRSAFNQTHFLPNYAFRARILSLKNGVCRIQGKSFFR